MLFDPSTKLELHLKDRRPDEGMDLFGYLYAAMDTSGTTQLPCNGVSADVMGRLSCVLQQYIGRSLSDEMLEFDTMLVLKDYADVKPDGKSETDPRWRQDWLGDFNAGNTQQIYSKAPFPAARDIRAEKPFLAPTSSGGAKSANCNQSCCKFPKSPADTMCDGLPRARRVQDTYTREPNGNIVVNTLAAGTAGTTGASLYAPHDVQVGALGAAYVSIHPDPNYGPLDVVAQVKSGSSHLRFRVFTIDDNGVPALVKDCSNNNGFDKCNVNANGLMHESVNVGPDNADEVLLVASADKDSDASFSWRFGPATATLHIVSPLASQPAVIGQYVNGTLQKRQLVVYFKALDANGNPMTGLSTSDMVFLIGTQPIGGTPDCPGPNCDVTMTDGTGGSYMAVITIPDSFYPAGFTGREDLRVIKADGTAQSDTAPDALEILGAPQHQALMLVLDTSGSMNQAGKLTAARSASKLALDGLADDDYAGLVLFSTPSLLVDLSDPYIYNQGNFAAGFDKGLVQLSQTDQNGDTALQALQYVVDNIPAAGSTSIGNGLFRAEDALVTRFGNKNDVVPGGVRQEVMLLSDGLNNCDWTPRDYLLANEYADAAPIPFNKCPNGKSCECDPGTVPTAWPWGPNPPTSYTTQDPTPLGFEPRSAASVPVPFFTGVGVGQADMGTIDELATNTGGVSFWVPDPPSVQQLQLDFADGFRMAEDSLGDYQRVLSAQVHDIGDLLAFGIDPGTSELVVSAFSADPTAEPPADLELVDPSGAIVAATHESANDAVFRVSAPAAGSWSFKETSTPPGASGSDPLLFAEVAVHSPCRMFTQTSVDGALPRPLPAGVTDDQHWRGRDLVLQALLHDGAMARPDASINATVTAPDGTEQLLTLFDDGRHDDGRAGDGLFAVRFHDTAAHQENPGDDADTYRVRYDGAVSTSSGSLCPRERVDSATVHAAPDEDNDGLPDWWQAKYQLPSGSADDDPDRDGLDNLHEFLYGTNPLLSDSDGGGESDLSERTAGRDPLDPSDDATGKPDLVAVPGNGRVLLQPGVPVLQGVDLEIQSGPTRQGPFAPALTVGSFSGPDVAVTAPNGTPVCYTARLVGSTVTSGWSRPSCTTPRPDPVPPVIERVGLAGSYECVIRPVADLDIEASDGRRDVSLLGEETDTYDPDVEVSGVSAMRLSPTTSDQPGTWEPFWSENTVDMGDSPLLTVVVRVRDAAGNESRDVWVQLERCQGTGLANSILLEEDAVRRFRSGDTSGARDDIKQSLVDLEQSLGVVDSRLRAPHDPGQKTDSALHAGLSGARGLKRAALQAPPARAAALIEKALDTEYDAEATAFSRGAFL